MDEQPLILSQRRMMSALLATLESIERAALPWARLNPLGLKGGRRLKGLYRRVVDRAGVLVTVTTSKEHQKCSLKKIQLNANAV